MIHHRSTPILAALVGLATGLAISNASGERALLSAVPTVRDLAPALPDDPTPALDNARMALAVQRAQSHLDEDQPWAAWKELRPFVKDAGDAPDAVVLLAARAAAGWEGWSQVRRLLSGREGLEKRDGEGLFLLARSLEAKSDWSAAANVYQGYLKVRRAPRHGEAAARLGRVLARAGDGKGAAEAYARAAGELGAPDDWLRVLNAEALAKAGDARTPAAAGAPSGSAAVRLRLARAEAAYWLARGDTARAIDRHLREEGVLRAAAADPHAAELAMDRARLLAATGRSPEARDALRRVAADPEVTPALRVRAASRLGDMSGERTGEEQLARAAAFEAGNRPGLAARSLRAAIRLGATADPAQRLRLGRLLFEERDFRPAREVLAGLSAEFTDPAQAAEAELYAARALTRLGSADGWAEMRKLVEKRPGTAAAGTALYLLGDAATERGTAISYYRRAGATPSSYAREALYRVGDRSLKAGDPAGAISGWESLAGRFPQGEQTAEGAYRAGVLHERAGRDERARAMYAAAIAADPVSYYAIRAADRMGTDPLSRAIASGRAWPISPADREHATDALRRLGVLHQAGLSTEWKEELAWQTHRFGTRPGAMLLLAEGLATGGHTVDGIRIGRELLEQRGGEWDERLLKVVFPFAYRDLLMAEAERTDVDPYLLAGLVRQESSFNPKARSWVGATGLSQIMPATGAWLAPGAGVSNFDPSLLTVPEINLRMGSRYLRDQLKRYGGKRDLALAAYNAGPSRADRWRRELGYGGDVDAFRERIPFEETRKYVQLVLRNAVVYRRLYGGERSPGLSAGGS